MEARPASEASKNSLAAATGVPNTVKEKESF